MARTPLFSPFRRALHLAAASARFSPAQSADFVGEHLDALSRRDFLKKSGAASLLLATGGAFAGCQSPRPKSPAKRQAPRVAIVGGGIAGLSALHHLAAADVSATLHEGGNRVGGRMFTARDVVGTGTYTDFGGEFVNSYHHDVLDLVRAYDLSLHDTMAASEADLLREGFFFDGRLLSVDELVSALAPFAAQIADDATKLDEDYEAVAADYDRLSAAEYLDRLGARGWVRDLFEVVLTTEYGLEPDRQTALYLLWMLPTVAAGEVKVLGESDEQYRIQGGSQALIDALARRHQAHIRTGQKLVAVRPRSGGYTLTFDGSAPVEADFVICTLPFSVLREVDLDLGPDLPGTLRQSIDELGYGTNGKVVGGFRGRPWREMGYQGTFYAAERFQLSWEHTLQQPTDVGGITFYHGGRLGMEIGQGSDGDQFRSDLEGFARVVPGAEARRNGRTSRYVWAQSPWVRGSYACWLPGQYTGFASEHLYIGENGEDSAEVAVGTFHFAGEHLSDDHQGYMNGGAHTGRLAAQAVLAAVG